MAWTAWRMTAERERTSALPEAVLELVFEVSLPDRAARIVQHGLSTSQTPPRSRHAGPGRRSPLDPGKRVTYFFPPQVTRMPAMTVGQAPGALTADGRRSLRLDG